MIDVDTVRLTDEQLATAKVHQMTLNRLISQLDDLEACGAECQDRRRRVEMMRRQLEALIQKFGA